MSTLKTNPAAQRIALLAAKNEQVFHVSDLANLWLIENKNTLRTCLKRYAKQGLLHRIYRGFYSINPPEQIDPIFLGMKAIHGYCYLSTETILYREGYISQIPSTYTFVSEKNLRFEIAENIFISRQLHPKHLYQNEGVEKENGTSIASKERAIADMLYFNPMYHFDKEVNWNKIRQLQKKLGYPLTPNRYDSPKTK